MEKYFEPSGRLIMTIGKDLIKDLPAAVVELVKNAYDADASKVIISYVLTDKSLSIQVKDDGHGMTKDVVLNSWMVPSTNYKEIKRRSPKGRLYQGQKGIGRYATSILGNKLNLSTIKDGVETKAFFDWQKFDTSKKLSTIPVDINVNETKKKSGTVLEIINEFNNNLTGKISDSDFLEIEKELTKLMGNIDDFEIYVKYKGFNNNDLFKNKKINPLKLNDAFLYRLSGLILPDLSYDFCYQNSYTKESKPLHGSFKDLQNENFESCGKVEIDYRVFDKDPDGIQVILDFVNERDGTNYSKTELKKELIKQSGISIFRNDFRIRPYGDKGFDWLDLDSKRVQNPSKSIGSEQISGRIYIEPSEDSGLKEKSARDGLYENNNFKTLYNIAIWSLELLELERYRYRQEYIKKTKHDINKNIISIEDKVNNILDITVQNILKNPNESTKYVDFFKKEVHGDFSAIKKTDAVNNVILNNTVSTYQKHATLGNVISIILHEGRKPLSWYTNKLPQMHRKVEKLLKNCEISNKGHDDLLKDISKLKDEADRMSKLFKRLDPLSSNKRAKKKIVNVKNELFNAVEIFKSVIEDYNIKIKYDLQDNIRIKIVSEDLYMALTNIIENAIFWVNTSKKKEKEIKFKTYEENGYSVLEIIDNGPGIRSEDIKDNKLFIPGFSRKNTVTNKNGTGLGLTIAGEAIKRSGGSLEAVDYRDGGFFRIKFEIGKN